MNKKDKIILASVMSLLAIGIAVGTAFIIKKYSKKNKNKVSSNKNIKSILFVGDSMTVANGSYADIVGKNYTYKKLAKVGISTNTMLDWLKTELDKNKYDLVVIFGGYNNNYAYGSPDGSNISYKLNKTTSELQQMYNLSKSKGSKVMFITPASSINNKNYTSYRQEFHNQLNDWIMNSNADYKIDLYSMETGSRNNTKPLSGMTVGDGEHLGSYAHGLLAKEIEKKIS